LAVAWRTRHQLKDYERRGFAQFVYLTVSAHLEGVLADLLGKRCFWLPHMVHWEKLPPMRFEQDQQTHICDLKPLYESFLRVVAALEDESHTATLNKLIELYNVIFAPPLSKVIGKELYDDVLALASLRNLFAHGRDFFLEFEGPYDSPGHAFLDYNPIQRPALRLHKAGIIKDLTITGKTHRDFQSAFFADDALLYFYRAVEQIEEKLVESIDFLPEKGLPTIPRLPKLEP
jgi:hypothetical protein